jgi:hypothetical protein
MAKEIAKIDKAAHELGYVLHKITSKGHPMYRHTVTRKLVTISGTPSDYRSFKNALSKLRANAK